MHHRTWLSIAALSLMWITCSCERKGAEAPKSADTVTTGSTVDGSAPDNTARNKDAQDPATKTPMDQSNSGVDVKITASIRRAIMDDKSMSVNAQNCKIITEKSGVVTLRGPVASQAEKDAIAAKATATPGVTRVVNELEVTAP